MKNRRHLFIAAGLLVLLTGCQKMNQGGRIRPYAANSFFPNGSAAQVPVEGTVPRSQEVENEAYLTGKVNGAYVRENPVRLTEAMLKRGQERFNIYCAPCHSPVGDGDGMIVRRGFTAPPSYHTDRLRAEPDGDFFDVITHGHGAMFSYADRVSVPDRWAIVAYIRALQLSQHAKVPANGEHP